MTARAVRRLPLFLDERDALAFLGLLSHTTKDVATWRIVTYCLMPNHVHLVVEAEVDQLSLAMQRVNGLYAQRFNRVHGFRGHLFQGRYHSKAIREEAHLPGALRYVALNPVRAGLCTRPERWRWSSYRATVGLEPVPPFLDAGRALSAFGTNGSTARLAFRRFVEHELGLEAEAGTVPGTVPVPPTPAPA